MSRWIQRKHVEHEVKDDGGLLYDVERTKSGSLTACVRVYGYVEINGETYSMDQNVRVRLKKDKKQK